MEFSEVMNRRHSCRRYRDQPVEREKLLALAQAGRLSPSACNSQRWVFLVVDDPAKCAVIAEALVDEELHVNTFAPSIPAYLVIVGHPHRNPNEKQKRLLGGGEDWSLMDMGIAAQQVCLAATDMGLGSVMMGWFRPEPVKAALDIPTERSVALIIGVGYPQQERIPGPGRLEPEQVIRLNSYRDPAKGLPASYR